MQAHLQVVPDEHIYLPAEGTVQANICLPATHPSVCEQQTLPLAPRPHSAPAIESRFMVPERHYTQQPHLSACQYPQLLLVPCPCQHASAGQPGPLHQRPCLLRQICLLCAVPLRPRLATSALPAAAGETLSGLH